MYDWYVNHNRWIDTFGLCRMDRRMMKPIAARIREDYGRLMRRDAGEIGVQSGSDAGARGRSL
jgi:beta-galactosidase